MPFVGATHALATETPDSTLVLLTLSLPNRALTFARESALNVWPAAEQVYLSKLQVLEPGSARFVFGLGVGPTPVDLEWKGAHTALMREHLHAATMIGRVAAARANGSAQPITSRKSAS